jgi:hypothetical protein
MSWVQWLAFVTAITITNFVSLAVIFGVIAHLTERKKRKTLDPILEKIEESIMDEINFMDIVRNFERDDKENGETNDER